MMHSRLRLSCFVFVVEHVCRQRKYGKTLITEQKRQSFFIIVTAFEKVKQNNTYVFFLVFNLHLGTFLDSLKPCSALASAN